MGAAEAKLFAGEGAKVVIGDVLEAEGRQTEAKINESGGECLFVPLDVTKEADWEHAVATVATRFGKLDVLVNNAGILRSEGVEETTDELWDLVMEVNAKGIFLGTKTAVPEMRKGGGGSIINISSILGLVGSSRASAYSASKGAVRIFTKNAAVQYAGEGIRVNSVHPGFVESPMTQAVLSDPAIRRGYLEKHPLGRLGQPEDIAYGVLFLASDESSFVTGSELVIDGGFTAQ